ncbi:MAG: hypothetical protein LBD13_05355 [Spirochaetaceae bacterium]|jgi:hypothetical protein|nr:hypothetical protein [Spirochaetaceae bacterium]
MGKKIKTSANLLLAGYLTLALAGTSGFAMTENIQFEFYAVRPLHKDAPLPDHEYNDWRLMEIMEDSPAIDNAKSRPSLPARFAAPRVFTPLDIQRAGALLSTPSAKALKHLSGLTVKNTILLKLRI